MPDRLTQAHTPAVAMQLKLCSALLTYFRKPADASFCASPGGARRSHLEMLHGTVMNLAGIHCTPEAKAGSPVITQCQEGVAIVELRCGRFAAEHCQRERHRQLPGGPHARDLPRLQVCLDEAVAHVPRQCQQLRLALCQQSLSQESMRVLKVAAKHAALTARQPAADLRDADRVLLLCERRQEPEVGVWHLLQIEEWHKDLGWRSSKQQPAR